MKLKALFLSALLVLAAPASAAVLPPYNYTDATGRAVTLAYPKNSMTILHFWATWCAPCVKELPTLDALAAKLATISSKQWRVIAVSLDDKSAVVSGFLKRYKIGTLEANTDPSMQAMRALSVGGLPTTLVIDDKGNELKRYVGDYDWRTFDPATLDVKEPKPLYE